jgi:hypothetical protein
MSVEMDILIKNKYYITENNTNDNFHIVLYYLSDNKCKIVIRRLDDVAWGQDLQIILSSIDDNSEDKISLGSCNKNIKIIEIYTNIKLYKTEYFNQIIPKVIIQTSNENMNKNIYHYNSIMTFIELNPEYEFKIFDDKESREFIINNSDKFYNNKENNEKYDIIDLYDKLFISSMKANFFKLFYLYIMGGCYFHCKMILKTPLSKIIDIKDDLILCNNDNNDGFYNGILCSEKNNILIYESLQSAMSYIKNENIGETPYRILGKDLLKEIFKNNNAKIRKNENNIYDINNNIIIERQYKDYNNNYDYQNLWNNNKYFFKNSYVIKNYKFYFYPSDYNDKFEIIELKNNVFMVKRIDDTCGWGQNIKLKVINIETNDTYILSIDNSDDNEKPFIIE